MEPFHADWVGQYKYDSTFETDDNYSIRFEMKKNTIRIALVVSQSVDQIGLQLAAAAAAVVVAVVVTGCSEPCEPCLLPAVQHPQTGAL